jgi:hypothetical protein
VSATINFAEHLALVIDKTRREAASDAAFLLDDVVAELRGRRLSYAGPWGLHTALILVYSQSGYHGRTFSIARDWILRTALDVAMSGQRMHLVDIVGLAAESARLCARENLCDA